MKGLVKVFSVSLAMLKEWRMIGLLKGCMWESVGSCFIGQPQKRWIDSVKDCSKKKMIKCWVSKKDGV